MLEYIRRIEIMIDGCTREQFIDNFEKNMAVSLAIQNIGELSKELPDGLKEKYGAIPWAKMVGMRNRAAHGYHTLDLEMVWKTAAEGLTDLKNALLHEKEMLETATEY